MHKLPQIRSRENSSSQITLESGKKYIIPVGYYTRNSITVIVPESRQLSGDGVTYNVKAACPDDYQTLTVDDFIVEVTQVKCQGGQHSGLDNHTDRSFHGTMSIGKSYNPSTGVLTITGYGTIVNVASGYMTVTAGNAYLIPKH